MTVIVSLEIEQLHLQVSGRPEEGAVQTFASNGSNQPFDEWMRERHVRHRLDFPYVECSQVRLPLVKPIQRIMVRAEVGRRRSLASHRSIEYPAQTHAINDAAVHAKGRRCVASIACASPIFRESLLVDVRAVACNASPYGG